MGEFDVLKGKAMTEDIGEMAVTLVPLTLEDFDIVMEVSSNDPVVVSKGIKNLVRKTLERSYPKEKNLMEQIDVRYMNDLVPFVLRVNGLSSEEEESPLEVKDEGEKEEQPTKSD